MPNCLQSPSTSAAAAKWDELAALKLKIDEVDSLITSIWNR